MEKQRKQYASDEERMTAIREYHKRYYQANREAIRERSRVWRAANKDMIREKARQQRARKVVEQAPILPVA